MLFSSVLRALQRERKGPKRKRKILMLARIQGTLNTAGMPKQPSHREQETPRKEGAFSMTILLGAVGNNILIKFYKIA